MNQALKLLHPYPFEKLARIRASVTIRDGLSPISLAIGEPKHATPAFITEAIISHLHTTSNYPTTLGTDALRVAIADWLCERFSLPAGSLNPAQNVIPVNGTREALFAIAQCVVDRQQSNPTILMPNPFYQIYEGAALLAGAQPVYLNCTAENDFIPDFEQVADATWKDCQLLYLCSPGNPTGSVIKYETLCMLMDLADRHDFVIASDECYSEIYFDDEHPPVGLLEAAARSGRTDYRRCVVFHSLSKRSNSPGIRSGFVAGDATLLKPYLLYRTYHGCTMPLYTQSASILAWQDESHVAENRRLYREKFDAVMNILSPVLEVEYPEAGFYLWPQLPCDDIEFARGLLQEQNVTILPGSFLGRESAGINPGHGRARIALVAPLDECIDAANRIKLHLQTL